MGDPAGIGGELVVKALDMLARKSIPVIIGDRLRSGCGTQGSIVPAPLAVKPLGQAPAG